MVVSNLETSKETILLQLLNIFSISSTFLVSNCEINSRLLQLLNIERIRVTFEVSKFDKSKLLIKLQLLKVYCIFNTSPVYKPDRYKLSNFSQLLNI